MAGSLRIEDLDVLKQQINALLNQFDLVEAATTKTRRVRDRQDSSTWSPFTPATQFANAYRTEIAKVENDLRTIRTELENMRTALDKGAADLEATEAEVEAIFARLNKIAEDGAPLPPAYPGPTYPGPTVPGRPPLQSDGNRVPW